MIFSKKKLFLIASLFLFLTYACKKEGSNIRENPVKIDAKFVADFTNLKQGDVVNFSDSTTGFPLTWNWTFEGGEPSTSTVQNPKNIKYNQLGSFSVTLVTTNAYGKDSLVKKSYIKVLRELFVPIVETIEVFDVNGLVLKAGGNLIDTGSGTVTEMGVCWDTTDNPSIRTSKSIANSVDIGDFLIDIKDLKENTIYYYRAYAINEDGVGYGAKYSIRSQEIDTCDFLDYDYVSDRDGNQYRITKIGGKSWMADNLNYETENSWCYNNLDDNCEKYGRLYSIEAAQNACPVGWRLPSNQEWDNLLSTVGSNAGVKLKAKNEWYNTPSKITDATNTFCFSALPGGYKDLETGYYITTKIYGYWWTSTKNSENRYWSKNISYDNNSVFTIGYENNIAFSVRCIKD